MNRDLHVKRALRRYRRKCVVIREGHEVEARKAAARLLRCALLSVVCTPAGVVPVRVCAAERIQVFDEVSRKRRRGTHIREVVTLVDCIYVGCNPM